MSRQIIFVLIGAFAVNLLSLQSYGGRPEVPSQGESRWARDLKQRGFDTTRQGLARALTDQFGAFSALKYLSEIGAPAFLDEAEQLLAHDSLLVQTAAAELLVLHGREKGIAWAQQWERMKDNELLALSDGSVGRAILRAAGMLAQTKDDRLARHVRTLLHWRGRTWSGLKITAARELGYFSDLRNPLVEQAWIDAARIAHEAITITPPDMYSSLQMYLQTLNAGALHLRNKYDVRPTPAIMAAFETLATVNVSLPNPIQKTAAGRVVDYNDVIQSSTRAIWDTWRSAPLQKGDSNEQ